MVGGMIRWTFVALCALLGVATPSALAVSHEVFAHGAAERMWVGRFQIVPTPRGDVEQTDLIVRAAGPGQQWKALASVPSHARSLASRDGQAVVLLSDGQWTTVWAPDGASTGQPLPAGAEIRALGDDGKSLWAVGAVPGGWAALASHGPASEPYVADGDNPPSFTTPTTAPTAPTAPPTGPVQDVLFHQSAGAWLAVAPLPSTADEQSGGEVAITVAGERVSIATVARHGSIDVTDWAASTGWSPTRRLQLPRNRVAVDLQWIAPAGTAELWATDGQSPGWLFRQPTIDDAAISLSWNGPNAPVGLPAIAVAGGYVRVVGLHDGNLYEQRYEPDGRAVGEAALLAVPVDVDNSPLQTYLNYGLLAALLLSAGATLYRRSTAAEADPAWIPPPAAPLIPRIIAGFIDALPVLITAAVVSIRTDNSRNALDRLQELPAVIALGASVAFYILHTAVLELLTRRSVGKWLMGLRAISVDGKRATAIQIVLRNGLRVIDLLVFPLAIALLSPQRQRSADIAAGTMVVLDKDPAGQTNVDPAAGVSTEDQH